MKLSTRDLAIRIAAGLTDLVSISSLIFAYLRIRPLILFTLLGLTGCALGETKVLHIEYPGSTRPSEIKPFESSSIRVAPVEDRRMTPTIFEVKNQYGQTILNYRAQSNFAEILTVALKEELKSARYNVVEYGGKFLIALKFIDTTSEQITGFFTSRFSVFIRSNIVLRDANTNNVIWSDMFTGKAEDEASWYFGEEDRKNLVKRAMQNMLHKIATSADIKLFTNYKSI